MLKNELLFTILGGTGNLARYKVYPALYLLFEKNLLPKNFTILGIGRSIATTEEYVEIFRDGVANSPRHKINKFVPGGIKIDERVFAKLAKHLLFYQGDFSQESFYPPFRNFIKNHGHNRLFYLATVPSLYKTIFENLGKANLNREQNGWVRIMVEKPFGHNLETAMEVNKAALANFDESQIFRIDHYLGKETMQNILAFRFGNSIFEPLWNKEFVDHIQITALEDYGIRGRGAYYDATGALRDVVQNHCLQMLAVTLMDPPASFSMDEVRRRRIEIINTLNPFNLTEASRDVVFGQYESYKKEPRVAPNSRTETFVSLKTYSDDPHWKDIPIYIRAGKMTGVKLTEINVVFKPAVRSLHQNVLTFRIEPNEGVALELLVKRPGHGETKFTHQLMDFCYRRSFKEDLPDPYSKLILDAIRGDQTSFTHFDEIKAEWKYFNPILKYWEKARPRPIVYKDGSMGPKEAEEFLKRDKRSWIPPRMQLCRI